MRLSANDIHTQHLNMTDRHIQAHNSIIGCNWQYSTKTAFGQHWTTYCCGPSTFHTKEYDSGL